MPYLVKKVLHKYGKPNVEIMSMNEKCPPEEAKTPERVVAASHSLSSLFTHYSCKHTVMCPSTTIY